MLLFVAAAQLTAAWGASTVYVSNIEQAPAGGVTFNPIAHDFTTGPNADGYEFDSVDLIVFRPSPGTGDFLVELCADSFGSPGTVLATLSGPNPVSAAGETNTYASASGVFLSPGTRYWIRASWPGTASYGWAQKDPGHTSPDGWTISTGGLVLSMRVKAWPTGRHATYAQDFSAASVGATNMGDGSQLFSTAPGTVAAVQDGLRKELQLTAIGSNDTRTAFLLPDLDTNGTIHAFSAKWNAQVYGNFPSAADGFSFNFGRIGALDLISTNYALESGYGRGISFGVQTYQLANPGFYVRAGTNVVATVPFNALAQWGVSNNFRHFFEVDWHHLHGLTARLNGQTIFSNVPTYGFIPQRGSRFAWAARTGGLSQEVRLDNIAVVVGGTLSPLPTTSPHYGQLSDTLDASLAFDGDSATYWATPAATGVVGATFAGGARNTILYTLTASDSGARADDPLNWFLQGSTNAGASWTDSGAASGRFLNDTETRCWLATNPAAFHAHRLRIVNNNGGPATRLSELRAYKLNAVTDAPAWSAANVGGGSGWQDVAMTPDGIRMAAGSDDGIYLSTNSGRNWVESSAPGFTFSGVAMSDDGSRLVAGDGNQRNYGSTNAGATWAQQTNMVATPASHYVDCSSNGMRQATAVGTTGIFYSADGGATWALSDAPAAQWSDIKISANGVRQYAAASGGVGAGLYRSGNSGVNWTLTSAPLGVGDIACSADGARVFASSFGAGIYFSHDSGTNWTASDAPTRLWRDLACSADGLTVVACESDGDRVYLSTDSGVTWTLMDDAPAARITLAASADAHTLVAANAGTLLATHHRLPQPPAVQTRPATAVGGATATLHAQARAFGAPTTVRFAWGVTTNYGNTNVVSAGSSIQVGTGTNVSVNLTGLTPGTLYHYRAIATNTTGPYLRFGEDMTFTTTGSVPAVTTLAADQKTFTSARLNGQVDPGLLATMAWFEWGANTNYGNVTLVQNLGVTSGAQSISATITGLIAGATVHFRAVATNLLGRVNGANLQFGTRTTNQMFDRTVAGDAITASSGNTPIGQGADKAIDDSAATKYLNSDELNTGFTVWPSFTDRPVRALTLISADDAPERDPASVVLEGSLDGTNFTLIASNTVPAFAGRLAIQSVDVLNETIYSVFRVTFPNVADAGTANAMQVAEVEFMPYGDITSTNDTISIDLPSGAVDENGVDKLIDGKLGNANTLDISALDPGDEVSIHIIPTRGPTVLKGFEFIGCADDLTVTNRRPGAMVMAGSNDGINFSNLLAFSFSAAEANHQLREFQLFNNTATFSRYRFLFTDSPFGDRVQLGELRLFGLNAPGNALDAWRLRHFGTTNNLGAAANGADVEGDAIANLMEFASGSDPSVSNASSLFLIAASNGAPHIYYIKDTNANGTVTWTIQAADSPLNNWTNRSGSSAEVETNATLRTIRFSPSLPATGEVYRLGVTVP